MTVARFPPQAIAGEKISYGFGKVVPSRKRRWEISFNKNGHAYVVKRWVVREPEDVLKPPGDFLELDALAAHADADEFKDEGKVPMGSHREWKGVLRGHAIMRVTAPRHNVEYRQPPL